MSIASKLTLLQQDITNARTAITTKGGTVTQGGGSSQLATDINTIPTQKQEQSKTLTLGSVTPQTVTPDSNKVLSSVPVTIDSTIIKAENIKKDVVMLGIVGTHEGGTTPTGTINITQNGTHDVTNYASANVNVEGGGGKKWGVSIDNFWRTSAKAIPDLEDLVIPQDECPRLLGYLFQYAGLKSITINAGDTSTFGGTANGNPYVFGNNPYLESVLFDNEDRTAILGQATFAYALVISSLGSPPENPLATFEYRIKIVNGASCFNSMFQNNVKFKYFYFPNLQKIGTSSATCFVNCFYNTNQCYSQEKASVNQFRFPVLQQIGGTSSSYYGIFRNAFSSSYSSTTSHYGKLLLPELTTSPCKSSTATNGHFSGCSALDKVYLPKLTSVGTGTTYSKYMFNSCTNLTEIHFGIENQATVEAFDGYATRFGATNATIYFDMPNHLTVDGVMYDRSGAEYDYDNSYYSWKNGTDVIYTTNAINPQVNDTVYTKSGDTYVSSGTIGAIA